MSVPSKSLLRVLRDPRGSAAAETVTTLLLVGVLGLGGLATLGGSMRVALSDGGGGARAASTMTVSRQAGVDPRIVEAAARAGTKASMADQMAEFVARAAASTEPVLILDDLAPFPKDLRTPQHVEQALRAELARRGPLPTITDAGRVLADRARRPLQSTAVTDARGASTLHTPEFAAIIEGDWRTNPLSAAEDFAHRANAVVARLPWSPVTRVTPAQATARMEAFFAALKRRPGRKMVIIDNLHAPSRGEANLALSKAMAERLRADGTTAAAENSRTLARAERTSAHDKLYSASGRAERDTLLKELGNLRRRTDIGVVFITDNLEEVDPALLARINAGAVVRLPR